MRWFDDGVKDLKLLKAHIEATILKWGFLIAMTILTTINVVGWINNAATAERFINSIDNLTKAVKGIEPIR